MNVEEPIFIDTWGWVALGHRRDQNHKAVKGCFEQLRSHQIVIHTSDYVLDEVMTILFKREIFQESVRFIESIFKSSDLGQTRIHRITSERFQETWKLRQKLKDKPKISFTDLTSMVIMRELGLSHVLTRDDHFLQVGMGFVQVQL